MKRFFDLFFSIIFLTLISPIFLIFCILIKLDSNGPIFFVSERVGINNTKFNMPKFRTMFNNTEIIETSKIVNSENKITRIGKWLRKYSIDELPQFFCVLIGKMSIVGPRPALSSQIDLLNKRNELGINKLKPGITGYAQINGRDLISDDEKIAFEYEYLKKRSFFLDLNIIIKTMKVVVKQKGILH